MKPLARKTLLTLAAVATLATAALPAPAHAWGRVGVFVGIAPFPLFYPAPRYNYAPPPPPPPYYTPPYAPYAPPRPVGFTCYARPYQCPLAHPKHIGRPCACLAPSGYPMPGTVIQ
jgi:hypothetical protein